MKKLILVILLLITGFLSFSFGQTIGFNGQGSMEHSTWDDWNLFKACGFEFVTRQPGGADTKFLLTDNDETVRGWDMSIDTINYHFSKNGTDENDSEEGLDKYTRKYNTQELLNISYEDKLVSVSQYVPQMQTMYNFNVFYSGKQRCYEQLERMIANGVYIPAVVFNNEVYGKSQYNFDFEAYRVDFEPFAIAIKQKYPDIKIGLCMAPDITSKVHTKFNDDLFNYIAAHRDLIDAVDIHQYLNQSQLPLSWAAMPTTKQVINFDVKDEKLATAWTTFYNEASANTLFEDRVGYINAKDPSVHIWCSEWNANPMSKWSNTVAHGAWVFRTFMEDSHYYEYFMLHNGIGSDIGSMISQVQAQDIPTDTNAVRVHFYSFLFSGSLLEVDQDSVAEVNKLKITGPGKWYGWYSQVRNDTSVSYPAISIADDLEISAVTNVYIYGKYPYTSAGVLSLMSKQQPKSDRIQGIVVTDELTMNSNSFGFFMLEVKNTKRDTVICSDSTFISGYNTFTVVDTIYTDKPVYCSECDRLFYRWFHAKTCRECNSYPEFTVVTKTDSVPVYKTVTNCDTVEIGMICPKIDEINNFSSFGSQSEIKNSIGSSESYDCEPVESSIPSALSYYTDKKRGLK